MTMTCLRSDQNMEAQREREIMGGHACTKDKKQKNRGLYIISYAI